MEDNDHSNNYDSDNDDMFGEDVEVVEEIDFLDDAGGIQIVDLSSITFDKHSKSVFTSDLSKNKQLAATGGEDDSAFVWQTNSGEILFECTGHKDSVTEVRFNYDNQYVVTGDMGGMIQVWDVKDQKLIWCFEGDEVEWLTWHPLVNVLISGSQSGDIYVWQIPQGNCKVLASHGAQCTCGEILPDGKKIIAGYSDGAIKLWDIKSSSVLWQLSNNKKSSVLSLSINADGSLLCIAPTSEIIKIADGKIAATLLSEGESEIEACLFINDLNILVTGSLSGQLCVWDLSKQTIRHQAKIECAVTVLKMGTNGKVFVGATDGAIYVCDVRTGTLLETLTGHKSDILSLSVPSDGTFVLSTSDDGTAKIYSSIN